VVSATCRHNAHMYYILATDISARTALIEDLRRRGISSLFHYVPLHTSPAGRRFSRFSGSMDVTTDISERLVRLPLWIGVHSHLEDIIGSVYDYYGVKKPTLPMKSCIER